MRAGTVQRFWVLAVLLVVTTWAWLIQCSAGVWVLEGLVATVRGQRAVAVHNCCLTMPVV